MQKQSHSSQALQPLVIATGNPGKVKEFVKILSDSQFEFKTLADIGFTAEIVEDGDSFDANARIKALAVGTFLREKGLDWPVLADDSGLEVDALNGAPGIFTARFAGIGATDIANYQKLLAELANNSNRNAQFVCSLCWHTTQETQTFHGTCPGTILLEPRGTQGFGYDPVFLPKGYDRAFGEMSHEEKKALSHRGFAIMELRKWLDRT